MGQDSDRRYTAQQVCDMFKAYSELLSVREHLKDLESNLGSKKMSRQDASRYYSFIRDQEAIIPEDIRIKLVVINPDSIRDIVRTLSDLKEADV